MNARAVSLVIFCAFPIITTALAANHGEQETAAPPSAEQVEKAPTAPARTSDPMEQLGKGIKSILRSIFGAPDTQPGAKQPSDTESPSVSRPTDAGGTSDDATSRPTPRVGAERSADPAEALRRIAGRWEGVTSDGNRFEWIIHESGRYESLYREFGRVVRLGGSMRVNPDGSIQYRGDNGQTGSFTITREASGVQVLRGTVSGQSVTYQARQVEARVVLRTETGQPAGVTPGREAALVSAQRADEPDGLPQLRCEIKNCSTISYREVHCEVPAIVDLTNDSTARSLLTEAARFAQAQCPKKELFANIKAVLCRPGGPCNEYKDYLVRARNYDVNKLTWFEYHNAPLDELTRRQRLLQEEEQRRRFEEQRLREAEERRKKEAEAQKQLVQKVQAFADKHGVNGGWVHWQRLRANPFAYEGKVLMFDVKFERMITPTSGIFGEYMLNNIVVTDIPRGSFVEPRPVLLAGKVTGFSTMKNDWGGVPQVKYVGHTFCQLALCADYSCGRIRAGN